MYQDKYVFAQLTSFLNRSKFNRIVVKYDGDKYVKPHRCFLRGQGKEKSSVQANQVETKNAQERTSRFDD